MKRGQRPVPTALKILRGNPSKRPLSTQEPHPAPASLEPPTWLGPEAVAEWQRLAPILWHNGILTEIDVDALAAYCETWVRWKAATAAMRRHGMVIQSPNGMPMPSPWVSIANQAMATMRALLSEFGMTPSARVRVHAAEGQTGAPTVQNKWAGFLE